jgi:hypothetical protein
MFVADREKQEIDLIEESRIRDIDLNLENLAMLDISMSRISEDI